MTGSEYPTDTRHTMKLPGLSFEVNNIFCIGRNYALHARELGNPLPEEPLVFLKPNSALLSDGGTVRLPSRAGIVHHEVEFVIAIGKKGRNIDMTAATDYIAGGAVGIDMTARDLQAKAKQKGRPWTLCKGFDTFAVCSRFLPPEELPPLDEISLRLTRNGSVEQESCTASMIFSAASLIHYLSACFTLQPGDLIYTGTPAGTGPVEAGDRLEASLGDQQITLKVDVANE